MPQPQQQDPIALFESWFKEATLAGIPAPEAMTLATTTSRGFPSARIVLFKGIVRGAFVFFTNYKSRKGRELTGNPRAALVFHWEKLGKQVRIEGQVVRSPRAESDQYFASRERGRQVGAWASAQSEPVESREVLVEQVRRVEEKFKGRPIPRPPHWGGFRVIPERIEFWTSGEFRLHDRIVFERQSTKATKTTKWKSFRLSP